MEVKLSEQFLSDVLGLRSSLQQKCWDMLAVIQRGDGKTIRQQSTPGWRLHQLETSPFTSISVDMNYRMLCKLEGQIFRACRVVKHDLADAARVNRNDAFDTPYAIDNNKIEPRDVFASLTSMGLSEEHVRPFKGVTTEEEFIESLAQVDNDLQTYALALYETAGDVIPRSKYTVFDMGNTFELALQASMEQWELYLHPSQQYLVELPVHDRVSVGGSAGTGKTVCAWYRAQHLAQQGYKIGFICPNKSIFEVSQQMLASLLQSADSSSYFLIPNSADDIIQLANEVDHIIVDEAQELPPTWLLDIGRSLSTDSTGMTLFYDLNQLSGNVAPGDTRRINHKLDAWHSTLLAITRLTNMGLHINYRNSREIAEYYQETLAPFLPDKLQASVPLFGAGEVVVEAINDRRELGVRIARVVRALQDDYADNEIGLIFNSYLKEDMHRLLDEIRTFGIETTKDVRNKTMILAVAPRAAKGHERKAIVFCTPPMGRSTRKWGQAINVYIALTRARDRLVVLQSS